MPSTSSTTRVDVAGWLTDADLTDDAVVELHAALQTLRGLGAAEVDEHAIRIGDAFVVIRHLAVEFDDDADQIVQRRPRHADDRRTAVARQAAFRPQD